jgi:DNA-binding Lrp family transcriptional regulator
MPFQLTEKDRDLLSLLQQDARAPVSGLARRLGLSRTTVQDRIKRMERAGVIIGYSVRVQENISPVPVRAFVTMEVDPRQTPFVVAELKKIIGIRSVHTVAGKYDLVAVAGASDTAAMDALLDKIGAVPGLIRTESAIILSTKFDHSLGSQ